MCHTACIVLCDIQSVWRGHYVVLFLQQESFVRRRSLEWRCSCTKYFSAPSTSTLAEGLNFVYSTNLSSIRMKGLKHWSAYSSSWNSISELWGVTCHMGSHSVTCHPSQVNTPCLNPSQTGQYSIYLRRSDGRLSWPKWLVTYQDGLPVHRQSAIQVPSSAQPGVELTTCWSQVRRSNHNTTKRQAIYWILLSKRLFMYFVQAAGRLRISSPDSGPAASESRSHRWLPTGAGHIPGHWVTVRYQPSQIQPFTGRPVLIELYCRKERLTLSLGPRSAGCRFFFSLGYIYRSLLQCTYGVAVESMQIY